MLSKLVVEAEWGRDAVPGEGTEGQPGWRKQRVPWETYRGEIVTGDGELRKDGAFATLYTVGAYATPNNPPDFSAFNLDDQADELAALGLTNTGPHVHRVLNEGVRRWISVAPIVKALDDPYPLTIARDDAIRVFRATLDRGPHAMSATEAATIILGKLGGYRHSRLYAEAWVGVPPADKETHAAKLRAVATMLKANGLLVCGPGWYTGNGEPADVTPFAFVDAYANQGYWGNRGLTPDNALRYRTLFQPAATPTPQEPTMPPTNKPALPDLCPFAEYTPLTRNFDHDGTAPRVAVWHGTAGLGDPYNWWNRPVAPNQAASADFWIRKDGLLRQYVKLVTQTSWSNGPLVKPDLSVAFLAWLVAYKRAHPGFTGNWWTVSIECEKDAENADALTSAQLRTGNRLARWLHAEFGIPLDRQHHLGHYQFDAVNRPHCPRLLEGEWVQLLAPGGQPEPAVPKKPDRAAYEAMVWSRWNDGAQWMIANGDVVDRQDGRDVVGIMDRSKLRHP